VLALTRSAAQEYATKGLRVNALVAGAFHTWAPRRWRAVLGRHPERRFVREAAGPEEGLVGLKHFLGRGKGTTCWSVNGTST
jgi:NAD(P)-dependent dehydrogenase (short-subunit alcohol dehydrogenase family)